jgi:outer membrane protein TolC
MRRIVRTTAALAATLVIGSAASLNAQPATIDLTLKDAVVLAFRNNLDLKVELYNPAMAEATFQGSYGIYNPVFSLGADYSRTANSNTITFTPVKVDQLTVNTGVSQLLPTGGTVGGTLSSSWLGNSGDFYSDALNLTLSQPLLRNFGRENTELTINISQLNKQGAMDRFRTKLFDTVAQVRNDYFKLYNLREQLAVQRTALALAEKILEETKGRVKAGVLPAMEILNAEFSAATREKAVIDAERAVRDQMDVLRVSLQLPAGEINVVDQPTKELYTVSEEQALALAANNRPELAAQIATIQANDLQQRVARNKTLPDLTLNANVGAGGFDPRFAQGLSDTASVRSPVWGVGLQFSYPIGNDAAKNEYVRTKLALEQSRTQLKSLESGIANDARTAIRLLAASYKQLDVTARGTAYAQERLAAFRKRNAVGLATTKDVFDVENDLVAAQGNQIQALVDYNNAITQLWRVTGELLDRQGIKVSDRDADTVYQAAR